MAATCSLPPAHPRRPAAAGSMGLFFLTMYAFSPGGSQAYSYSTPASAASQRNQPAQPASAPRQPRWASTASRRASLFPSHAVGARPFLSGSRAPAGWTYRRGLVRPHRRHVPLAWPRSPSPAAPLGPPAAQRCFESPPQRNVADRQNGLAETKRLVRYARLMRARPRVWRGTRVPADRGSSMSPHHCEPDNRP